MISALVRAFVRKKESAPFKLFADAAAALEGILRDGMVIAFSGVDRETSPEKLLGAVIESGAKSLTIISSSLDLQQDGRWTKSHSIRVGVAQDNFAAGESLPAIMQAYRWRDPKTIMRYGARLAAKSEASARLARRFEENQARLGSKLLQALCRPANLAQAIPARRIRHEWTKFV